MLYFDLYSLIVTFVAPIIIYLRKVSFSVHFLKQQIIWNIID